jgi:exopolyphosphatase / guanosine-5'-triphosphate,3'-diphosphate pyrophosphatase
VRVAAIDIGTNSVLLLVAELVGEKLVARRDESTITRLGQGVDSTGRLDAAAVARTLDCLRASAAHFRAQGVERVAAVATSVLRSATDGEPFLDRAAELLGARPRVISGREEAELTFEGALGGLGLCPGPVAVVDLGGGSTEFIVGDAAPDGTAALAAAVSLDVGAVRLSERHLQHDPPLAAEIAALRADACATLDEAPALDGTMLVGVGGTVTSLCALAHEVVPYDHARIHGARLSREQIATLGARLGALPLAARARLPALDPRRADVIVAGALLLEEIVRRAEAPHIEVSDRGVRWGLAARLVHGA